jgi:hypothetical protein
MFGILYLISVVLSIFGTIIAQKIIDGSLTAGGLMLSVIVGIIPLLNLYILCHATFDVFVSLVNGNFKSFNRFCNKKLW